MMPLLARAWQTLPLGWLRSGAESSTAGGLRTAKSHHSVLAFDRCSNPECERVRGVSSIQLRLRPGRLLDSLWYCGGECWEQAAYEQLTALIERSGRAKAPHHRVPLGLLMLSRGDITATQLQTALAAQRREGEGRIGEWLQHLGAATEEQVTAALGQQWSAPLLVMQSASAAAGSRLLPVALMEACRVLGVHWNASTRTLLTAFVDGIDYPTLFTIQQALDCNTEAGIVSEGGFERQMNAIRQVSRHREVGIRTVVEIAEMARILGNYCRRVEASGVRLFGCRRTLWARLDTSRGSFDVTFAAPALATTGISSHAADEGYPRPSGRL